MPKRAHIIAGILAPLCLVTFFLSTLLVELFGSHAAVAQLKALIVTPGLWIMIPAIAAAGGSGLFLSKSRKGRLVDAKKKRMVTNSLAATDEPVVHTGYRRYRPEMLKLGMNLYELSPQKVGRSLRLGRFSSSIGRLHAKSADVDGDRVFIGSMNFDPRSDQHNTEMGLFIQSPALAQQVLKLVDVIRQQGSYKVALAANGKDLVWTTIGPGGQEQVVEESETDAWTRIMLEVLSVIAPEGLL